MHGTGISLGGSCLPPGVIPILSATLQSTSSPTKYNRNDLFVWGNFFMFLLFVVISFAFFSRRWISSECLTDFQFVGLPKISNRFRMASFFLRDHLLFGRDYVAPRKVFGFCGWLTKNETIPSILSCCDFLTLFIGNDVQSLVATIRYLYQSYSLIVWALSCLDRKKILLLLFFPTKVLIRKFDFSSLKSSGDWTFV